MMRRIQAKSSVCGCWILISSGVLLVRRLKYWELKKWREVLLDPDGTFEDLLRISAISPAMIIYLDTVLNDKAELPKFHPSNPKLALPRRMWARMPGFVTNPLGAKLARYLP